MNNGKFAIVYKKLQNYGLATFRLIREIVGAIPCGCPYDKINDPAE